MKNLKQKSTEKCSYCSERALYRSEGLALRTYACMTHVGDLIRQEEDLAALDDEDEDSHTWERY